MATVVLATMKTATQTLAALRFHRITPADFGDIAHFMTLADSRACDYTFGGIILWAKHFNYSIAIADNTLYISGGREDNLGVRAFALPVGDAEFSRSVSLLKAYTDNNLWFSAIPEDRLHLFASFPEASVSELGPEWSDYLYDIGQIATLSGNAMKKKRNHVNRFLADNPDARLANLSAADRAECIELLRTIGHDDSPTGISEFNAVTSILCGWNDFAPYLSGSVLIIGDRIVGFTIGEPKGDTLHVHIEKCDHSVAGANEALASLYAAEMMGRNPGLAFANRQDDAGDPGLRASKQSWRPLRLLPKFNVRLT